MQQRQRSWLQGHLHLVQTALCVVLLLLLLVLVALTSEPSAAPQPPHPLPSAESVPVATSIVPARPAGLKLTQPPVEPVSKPHPAPVSREEEAASARAPQGVKEEFEAGRMTLAVQPVPGAAEPVWAGFTEQVSDAGPPLPPHVFDHSDRLFECVCRRDRCVLIATDVVVSVRSFGKEDKISLHFPAATTNEAQLHHYIEILRGCWPRHHDGTPIHLGITRTLPPSASSGNVAFEAANVAYVFPFWACHDMLGSLLMGSFQLWKVQRELASR